MRLLVRQQLLRDGADERVLRVGVGEQGANRQQDFGDGERGGPLVFQDVQADGAGRVDVAVVDARFERDLRREGGCEWVVCFYFYSFLSIFLFLPALSLSPWAV